MLFSIKVIVVVTSFLSVMSHFIIWRLAILSLLIMLFLALVSFSILLELIITIQLFFKKCFAVANPIPEEPPVIHIIFLTFIISIQLLIRSHEFQ